MIFHLFYWRSIPPYTFQFLYTCTELSSFLPCELLDGIVSLFHVNLPFHPHLGSIKLSPSLLCLIPWFLTPLAVWSLCYYRSFKNDLSLRLLLLPSKCAISVFLFSMYAFHLPYYSCFFLVSSLSPVRALFVLSLFFPSSSLVAFNKQFFLHMVDLAASAHLSEGELPGNFRGTDYRPGKACRDCLADNFCCKSK